MIDVIIGIIKWLGPIRSCESVWCDRCDRFDHWCMYITGFAKSNPRVDDLVQQDQH